MRLLGTIKITGREEKRIELCQGDLTSLRPEERFDLLIVSAFPDDYIPTYTSLIGALHRKGLSVADLAAAKELDLRTNFSCWLSQKFSPTHEDLRFDHILCFEPPQQRGHPPSVVGDIFRALMPILAEKKEIKTAAMPIVAAGDQGFSVAEILEPLLGAAIQWMEHGLPLNVLKIVAYSDWQAQAAERTFHDKASLYIATAPRQTKPPTDFDVFLSYAHENSSETEFLEQSLRRANPTIRLFFDRKSIDIGVAWQPEIFESLDRCRKVVAIFSPDYLASKVCKEEFNIAWVRSRDTDQDIIFPIYLYSANLPTYMKYRNYVDCREGDRTKLERASTRLLQALAAPA
ncbi:MAG: toll/interleukin-1 receptor domain-containing protein [Proteobacteria bacterium]|nr:toll/interleukin-1 receptor domain-containing protein [Pseudomonadota bacterium]MBU0967379.1 toll/interleukin-1 receptor domain-containing protein [Pseudomonadota bacterium]